MKQGKKFLALLLCLVMVCSMMPFASAAEESGAESTTKLMFREAEYNEADGWQVNPESQLWDGYGIYQESSFCAQFYLVQGGAETPVTCNDLTSTGPISISVFEYTSFTEVRTSATESGEATISCVHGDEIYSMTIEVVAISDPDDEGEQENSATLMFKYDDTELLDVSQFPNGIKTNHDLFFYHGSMNAPVDSIASSNESVVKITPWESYYKVYIAGAGETTLTYTAGDSTYSVTVVIPEGSDEPGGDSGEDVIEFGLYYSYSADGTDVMDASDFTATIGTNHMLYFYNRTETVPELMKEGTVESDNSDVIVVGDLDEAGACSVFVSGPGSANLTFTTADGLQCTAKVNIVAEFTITPGEFDTNGAWKAGPDSYTSRIEIEFRDESTDYFEFKYGNAVIGSGLKSENEDIVSIIENKSAEGIWGINMHAPGEAVISYTDSQGGVHTFAVTVVGDETPEPEPELEPGLKYRGMDWNGESWYENSESPLQSSWSTGIGYGNNVKFYFFDGEKEIAVPLSALVFSEHVSGSQPEGQDYIDLRAESFGTGSISYTVGDVTHSISVTVTLRDFAFYSTETASEAGYLESFKVTDADDVFYFVAKNGTLANVVLNPDFDAIADVAKVSDICWKITVTGTPEGRNYGIQYSGTYSGGGTFSGRNEDIRLTDAKPGLKYRSMNYGESGPFEDPESPLQSSWSTGIGYGNNVKFYFFNGEREIEVSFRDLVFSEHVSGSQSAGQDYIYLQAEKYGSGTISYTVDGKTYSVTVDVGLPNFGFYSTEAASPDTYLYSFALTESSKEFYFVAYGDNTITEVLLEGDNAEIAEAVKVSDTCWKITITGRAYGQFDFVATYSGKQGDYPFSDWGQMLEISVVKEQTNPMSAISGSYVEDSDNWEADDSVYEGTVSIEYVSGDTRFFQLKAGDTLVTSGLTSKDPSIVRVVTTGLTETHGIWGIDMVSGGVVTLSADVDGTTYNFTVVITGYYDDDMSGNETPKVTVNGVEYSIGIGDARSNNYDSITFLGTGMTLGCGPGMVWFIAAVSGDGTNELTEAPAFVYQYIKDVSVELVSYTNMDAGGNQSVPNCTYTTGTMPYHGAEVPTILVGGVEGAYFVSKIRVTVVVQGPDDDEPITYSWVSSMSYNESLDLRVSAESLSTADALNEILSSEDALYNWLEENYPNEYEKLMTAHENDIEASIRLELPAVEYDKVIVVNIPDRNLSISFEGQRGIKQTTIPGMVISGQVGAVWYLNFAAQEDCTVSYDGETFTCGILVAGTNGEHGHILQVEHSTFTGFDYAVRSTHDGIATGVYGCKIIDCVVGYYMDSSETSRSQMYGTISNTCFVNNEIAVQIVSIHSGLSPYVIRVVDCDLISNGIDFDVDNPGVFYFYRNYYGGFIDPNGELSVDNVKYRTALARYDFVENGTVVVTNPRRIAPCTFGPEDDRLCIDPTPGLYTVILTGMADELVIDSGSLEDMEEEAEITVSDEKEEEMGKWKFKDKKGHK